MGILVNLAILNFKKKIIIWPIFGHPVPIRNIYRGGGQHSNLNQSNKQDLKLAQDSPSLGLLSLYSSVNRGATNGTALDSKFNEIFESGDGEQYKLFKN